MNEEKLKEEYGEERLWEPFNEYITEMKSKGEYGTRVFLDLTIIV